MSFRRHSINTSLVALADVPSVTCLNRVGALRPCYIMLKTFSYYGSASRKYFYNLHSLSKQYIDLHTIASVSQSVHTLFILKCTRKCYVCNYNMYRVIIRIESACKFETRDTIWCILVVKIVN